MFINDPRIKTLPIKIIPLFPNLDNTIIFGKKPNKGGNPLILPKDKNTHQLRKYGVVIGAIWLLRFKCRWLKKIIAEDTIMV